MPSPIRPSHADAPADPVGSRRNRVLQLIVATVGVSSLLLLLTELLAARSDQQEAWVAAFLALFCALAWGLLRQGYAKYVPHLLVASTLATAVLSTLAYGSVRTAVNFLFVAAVTGAGIFLSKRALLLTLGASVLVLGLLIYAESHGWLTETPYFGVGLRVWLTYGATLAAVAIMVFYSRQRFTEVAQLQRDEIQRRQKTELDRDRQLERFARIFRSSPTPMLAQSARDGTILDVNPAFERCLHYSRNQLLGRTDVFLWARPEQRPAYVKRLRAQRRIDRMTIQALRANGVAFDALVSSEMADAREDRLIITTLQDVSEQNALLDQLRRTEDRFYKAFHLSPLDMAITRLSDDSIIELHQSEQPNPPALGQKTNQASIQAQLWADPAERERFVSQLKRDGRVRAYDCNLLRPDGSSAQTRLWAELIDLDGETCILTCAADVSQEKKQQALLLEVAKGVNPQAGEALFVALTRQMAHSLGASRVLVGELRAEQRLQTLAVWSDGAPQRNAIYALPGSPWAQTLNEQGLHLRVGALAQEFPTHLPFSNRPYQAYAGVALRDQAGCAIGVLNAVWEHPQEPTPALNALLSIFSSRASAELVRLQREREIQQLNRTLERRVRERSAELSKLNAELDSFAYSISHDLRAPLRAINGFTRLLEEQIGARLDATERRLLERVLSSTGHMNALIDDLLALARVNQRDLQWQRTNLSALVHEILDQQLKAQTGRELQRRIEPDVQVLCDPRLVRAALEHLLSNALKYSQHQPQALIEFGQTASQDGAPARLFIRDNGIGFDMAYASMLFKPFHRLHHSSDFKGTGIGLATVRRIIERHGGQIEAQSQVDQGACFYFDFGSPPKSESAP